MGGLELCWAAVAGGLCPPTHPVYCAGVLALRGELFRGTPSINEALSGDPEHAAPRPAVLVGDSACAGCGSVTLVGMCRRRLRLLNSTD